MSGDMILLESGYSLLDFTKEAGIELPTQWMDQEVALKELSDFADEIEARVCNVFEFSAHNLRELDELAIFLARIGVENEYLLERDIYQLSCFQDEVYIGGGLCKSISKFWRKHKKEIVIGIAVLSVVVAVTATIVCTAGTAGAAAGVAGGTAIKDLTDDLDKKNKKTDQKTVKQEHGKASLCENGDDSPSPPSSTLNLDTILSSLYKKPNSIQGTFITDPSLVGNSGLFSNKEFYSNPPPLPTSVPGGASSFSQGHAMPDPPDYFDSFDTLESYYETLRIEKRKDAEVEWTRSHIDNYAASICYGRTTNKIDVPAPFKELPLIGAPDQGTVHFHCGINNSTFTALDGACRFRETLDKEFAVQSHLIHSDSLLHGLTMVALEKLNNPQITYEALHPMTAICPDVELALLPKEILQKSDIQRSIDYEVATLSKIAKNIIAKNNPKLKQCHIAFSNAGYVFNEALKQLSPEYRETIIIITAGSTTIIDADLACKVYNLIGDKDWPSQTYHGGLGDIEKAKNRANIEIITQNETEGVVGGHYFLQPDYQDKIRETAKRELLNVYEIY